MPRGGSLGASGFNFYNSSASTNILKITDGGSVGIGTTSPNAKLEVNGDIKLSSGGSLQITVATSLGAGNDLLIQAGNPAAASDGHGGILNISAGNSDGGGISNGGNTYITGGYDALPSHQGNVILGHNGIIAYGNVGIGTTTPGATLDVNGTGNFSGTLNTSKLQVGDYDFAELVSGNYNIGGLGGGGSSLSFYTNATEKLRVTSAGKVGIGTTSPTAVLHLKAGAAAANSAPLKFTSGTLLTTPENGTIEYDGSNFYYTTGGTRSTLGSGGGSGPTFNGITDINNASGSINLTPSTGNSVVINQTTASTSSTTGAFIVSGGVGISGTLNSGGLITSSGGLSSTSGTAATAGGNQSSPSILLKSNYWNGSASAVDTWSLTNTLGTGANPTSSLTIDHPSGTTGTNTNRT